MYDTSDDMADAPVLCTRCPERPLIAYQYVNEHNAFHNVLVRLRRVADGLSDYERQQLIEALTLLPHA